MKTEFMELLIGSDLHCLELLRVQGEKNSSFAQVYTFVNKAQFAFWQKTWCHQKLFIFTQRVQI